MKYILALFAFVMIFGACQKSVDWSVDPGTDTTTNNPNNPSGGTLSAKVNGVDWTADANITAIVNPVGAGQYLVAIQGEKAGGNEKLGVIVDGFHTGSFPFTMVNLNGGEYIDTTDDYSSDYSSTGVPYGNVTVTTLDTVNKTISGTFFFKAYSTSGASTMINITNGVFTNVPYQKNAGVPPKDPSDTFKVQKDGMLFDPYGIVSSTVSLGGNSVLAIVAADSLGAQTMQIAVPENITPGIYNFDGFTRSAYYEMNGDTLKPLPNTGTLQVLQHNTTTHRITGNFSFVGYTQSLPADSSAFTAGHFSVGYP